MFLNAIRRDTRRDSGMLEVVRRDEALRSLPLWICVGVLITLVLSLWSLYAVFEDPEAVPATLAAALWCALVPRPAPGAAASRSRRAAAMPDSRREVYRC